MAQPAPTHASTDSGHMDPTPNRRDWRTFLQLTKWFALLILGLIFFLIVWLIGHAPVVPTFVIVAALVFLLGSLFH